MDLEKFYFTYGSDDVQPYCGGWTEVWAPNYQMACQAFRAVHPDRIPNILNCSSVYSATAAFQMPKGEACHGTEDGTQGEIRKPAAAL